MLLPFLCSHNAFYTIINAPTTFSVIMLTVSFPRWQTSGGQALQFIYFYVTSFWNHDSIQLGTKYCWINGRHYFQKDQYAFLSQTCDLQHETLKYGKINFKNTFPSYIYDVYVSEIALLRSLLHPGNHKSLCVPEFKLQSCKVDSWKPKYQVYL